MIQVREFTDSGFTMKSTCDGVTANQVFFCPEHWKLIAELCYHPPFLFRIFFCLVFVVVLVRLFVFFSNVTHKSVSTSCLLLSNKFCTLYIDNAKA